MQGLTQNMKIKMHVELIQIENKDDKICAAAIMNVNMEMYICWHTFLLCSITFRIKLMVMR